MAPFVRAAKAALIVLCLCTIGCQFRAADPKLTPDVTFVLPGLDGPGPWYGGLIGGLREGRPGEQVELFAWGAPLSILPNLVMSPMHDAAERRLAGRIADWRKVNPDGRIALVGHSAGCGIILDSLKRLSGQTQVDTVLLLAPAVSDEYELAGSLERVSGTMHVFHSRWDQILPSTFLAGTFGGAAGDAAGRGGFEAEDLPPYLQSHLQQHAHKKEWISLGCSGGHFGWRSKKFAAAVLAPLLAPSQPLRPALAAAGAAPAAGPVRLAHGPEPALR